MKKTNKLLILIPLIVLALTPLSWFLGRGSVLIDGLDTNFPLNPLVWFLRRFYIWNGLVNGGSDFSSSTSGLFFHFVQVIPFVVGLPLNITEIISLIFWFAMVVWAAYYFAKSIVPGKRAAQLIFVLIYSFNTYLFNTWENVKVSNLALMIGIPLFLGLLHRYNLKQIKLKTLLATSAVFGLIISGSGINPAYFFTIFLALIIYTLSLIVIVRDKVQIKRVLLAFLGIVIMVVGVNLFWILSLFHFLFLSQKIASLSDIGFTDWLNSLSQDTSLLNVSRLLGAWDWYVLDKDGAPLYIPYAANYLFSIPFIIFSFVLPTLAMASFLFREARQKLIYCFLSVLLILGIFLGAGSHEPTGVLFLFLTQHLPLFSFFRSPWYIFTPLLILSYAGLIALLVNQFTTKFAFKITTPVLLIFSLGYLTYSYPMLTGKIFRPGSNGFYIQLPNYFTESANWLNNQHDTNRIITYPDDQLESFTWGYKGTESILGLFLDREYIAPSFNASSPYLEDLTGQFYQFIKRQQYQSALAMLPYFSADTIFSKNDQITLAPPIDDNNSYLTQKMSIQQFGPWSFLKMNNPDQISKIFVPPAAYLNLGDSKTLAALTPLLNPKYAIVNSGDQVAQAVYVDPTVISEATNPTLKDHLESNIQDYNLVVSHSGRYQLIVEATDLNIGADSNKLQVKVNNSLIGNTSIQQTDSYLTLSSIDLNSGNNQLEITYPPATNLIMSNFVSDGYLESLSAKDSPLDLSKISVGYSNSNQDTSTNILVGKPNPFLHYFLSFDYKYNYGEVSQINFTQKTAQGSMLKNSTDYVGYDLDWRHRQFNLDLAQIDSDFALSLIMPKNKPNSSSKTLFENVNLKRIYDNRVFVIEDKSINNNSGIVSYKRLSPVEYEVTVANSPDKYNLAFLENYSNDWVASVESSNQKPVHYTVDGYANGWYFEGNGGEQKIKIYYTPQLFFSVGLVVAMLTLIGSLAVLIFGLFKRR